MKIARKFSLLFATLIVLVHGFVPHYHEDEMNFAQHESLHKKIDGGFLDDLALAFHEQSFSEDLKIFSIEDGQIIASQPEIISDFPTFGILAISDLYSIPACSEKQQIRIENDVVLKDIYLHSAGLRAPPVTA